MIAHCPACGTNYRHQILATPMRGRCGRCDAAIDLSRLRPYRLVVSGPRAAAVPESVTAAELPLPPLPAVAVIASEPVSLPVDAAPAPAPLASPSWESEDPLPPIPEMAMTEIDLPAVPAAAVAASDPAREPAVPAPAATAEGRGTTWLLWVAAGAIAGTGISWTLGGTTLSGVAAGTLAGAIAGWGWLRWMSPR